MRRKVKRWMAGVLVGTLLFSTLVGNTVMAEEQNEEETITEQIVEPSALNYLYIESPYIETQKEQNLVVSWGDGTENIEKLEVLYQYNGQNESFVFDNKDGGMFLYQNKFTKEEAGLYELTDIRVTQNGQVSVYDLEKVGIKARFEVSESYLESKTRETEEQANEVGVAVVSEADVENDLVKEKVEQALAEANADMESGAISVYALDDEAESQKGRSADGQVVVALDPGHDASHAGAYGNGVYEESATLKIAKYCKAELEKYAGVKVYMCRTSIDCPYPETIGVSKGNVEDIKMRVRASVKENADVYVSIHLNSYSSSSPHGAEVWYPDGSQTPNTVKPGKNLAENIQKELVAIGLYNRGAQETDDNFACMSEGGKYDLPAVIVEHAFVSNSSDANTYLKTDAGLKKLGIADAAGIAQYFKLAKVGSKADVTDGIYIIQSGDADNMAVDVDEASITLKEDSGVTSQQIKIVSASDGDYNLIAENTGKAIEFNGSVLQQKALDKETEAQKWSFISAGDGKYYLKSAFGSYLDVKDEQTEAGKGIAVNSFSGSNTQKWVLKLQKAIEKPEDVLESTEIKGQAAAFGAILFSWGKVTNATGYQIEDVTSSTAKIATTISSGTTSSYRLTGLNCSTSYKYRIRAFKEINGKKKYGEYSPIITVKTSDSVRGTINEANVNVRTGPNTSYKSIVKLKKGTKITVTGNSGSWYRVSVSVKSVRQTAYVSKQYITMPVSATVYVEKTTLTGTASAFDTVKLSWKKVSGASGYVIQRYDNPSKSYKTVKTITSGSIVAYNDGNLNANITFKYRIRAYKTVSGTKVYGAYSDVISAKTKEARPGVITDGPLNARTGPGTNYAVVTKLAKGTKVTVAGSRGEWHRVLVNVGGESKAVYVSKSYVKVS